MKRFRWLQLPLLLAGAAGFLSACGSEAQIPREALDAGIQTCPLGSEDAEIKADPNLDASAPDAVEADLGPQEDAQGLGSEVNATDSECPVVPVAFVFDIADGYTGILGTARSLIEAGFEVKPLPLDQTPNTLKGVIVFGSFASESPDYVAYMKNYAADLYSFVDRGNVLLQMTQASRTEFAPPFLPTTHVAQRGNLDLGKVFVFNPESSLLAGIRVSGSNLAWQGGWVGWEAFDSQGGFQVDLAADPSGRNPLLMQGAVGQGRIILAAMSFDKDADDNPERPLFRKTFFANLLPYVSGVCRRQTIPLNITRSQGATPNTGSYTFAVLPDIQIYSALYPGLINAQTGWIAANAKKRNIVYAFQLGDLTNNNTPIEWQRAVDAFSLIDNIVPYAIVTGNHDYGPLGDASNRVTLMNDYFSYQRLSAGPTFGGAFETGKLDNTYHLFSAGKRDFILLALEWGPRDEVIAWANRIMDNHPERFGIIITHAYLNNNDLRYDYTDTVNPQDYNPHFYGIPEVNDGEELWQKLVRKHTFIMVLSGHVLSDGTGYLASKTDNGITCHQMLSNYQFLNLGGEANMRLLEFQADGKTVRVSTYSPFYDSYLTDADQTYSFTLDWPAAI